MLLKVVYLRNVFDVLNLIFSKGSEFLTKLFFDCRVILVDLPVEAELQLFHDVVPKCFSCSCLCIVVCVILSVIFVVIQSV
jgi:hypothetical protein